MNFDCIPIVPLLKPLGALLLLWLVFKFFDRLCAFLRFLKGKGKRGALLVLLLFAVGGRCDEPPTVCQTPEIAFANEWYLSQGWYESCAADKTWCLTENVDANYCSDYWNHSIVHLPSCSCSHVLSGGGWVGDCPQCSGVFEHAVEPPAPMPPTIVLLVGFGSGIVSIGSLLSLKVAYRSIFKGLDILDRD